MGDFIKTSCELVGDLSEWAAKQKERINEETSKSVADQAEKVLETAKELCPVVTGTLKSSLRMKVTGNHATVGTDPAIAWYAFLVAFGSIHNPHPNNFLYTAADIHNSELLPLIKQAIDGGNND